MNLTLKKTVLGVAIAAALGVSAAASADTYTFNYSGIFTMLDPSGKALVNSSATYADPWVGKRTNITGTMTFDTVTGAGSGTVVPFAFFSGGNAVATAMNMQAVGNGLGTGPGSLVLGNMGFNWNGNNGIPVSIVLDAQGMFGAIGAAGPAGLSVGTVIGSAGGTLPASNAVSGNSVPIGLVPISTTTWNTTQVPPPCTGLNGASCMGVNPSGTTPVVVDPLNSPYGTGIGGNPMIAGPFMGYNANFDIKTLTVTSHISAVPVPAAAWLLGSGLLGLVGVARRKVSA
jgi:hypothetical protein